MLAGKPTTLLAEAWRVCLGISALGIMFGFADLFERAMKIMNEIRFSGDGDTHAEGSLDNPRALCPANLSVTDLAPSRRGLVVGPVL